MAGRKSTKASKEQPETISEEEQVPSINELDSLRDIVFGSAKKDLENQLLQLQENLTTNLQQLEKKIDKSLQDLTKSINERFDQSDDRLTETSNDHGNKEDELMAYCEKLSSELEIADTNNRNENDELHNRLDKELDTLNKDFKAKFDETLKKLNQMTGELNSSKTDRKTLAKLLATMATNLETDDE